MLEWKARLLTLLVVLCTAAATAAEEVSSYNWNW